MILRIVVITLGLSFYACLSSPKIEESVEPLGEASELSSNDDGINPAQVLPTPGKHKNISCTLKSAGGACDFIIHPKQGPSPAPTGVVFTKYTGTSVQPGQTVCLKGGSYPYSRFWIEKIAGTASAPVKITNCGGKFEIGNSVDANQDGVVDSSSGLEFYGVKHVKLTGTGSTAHRYGIKAAGTTSGQGIHFTSLSTDIEVEFVEVGHADFAGIMAKTDPNCNDTDPNSFRGGFVQRNTILHDNYIHDVGGEGFYIGFSFYGGYNKTCNGVSTKLYSHPLEGTRIYNNIVERTGCEAIQVGCGRDTEIFRNYVKGFGLSPFADYQSNAIQVGGGTWGKVYNNYVENPNLNLNVAQGVIIAGGGGPIAIVGNTIVNPGSGMYIHKDAGLGGYEVVIANNTIVNPRGKDGGDGRGIWSFNEVASRIYLINNLIVMSQPTTSIDPGLHVRMNAIYDQRTNHSNKQNGITNGNIEQVGNLKQAYSERDTFFVNASASDFALKNGSPAINAGQGGPNGGVQSSMVVDHAARTVSSEDRVLGGKIDVGAFER